jgi:ABC-type multidrug transport system permease subunit
MVLMMTVIYGGVFLTAEKREGMLRRQVSAPVSRGALLAGKVLGRAVIAGLQAVILLMVGAVVFGLSYGSLTGLAVLVASFVLSVAGLSTLVGAIARTAEQASTAGWLLSIVLAALGGCWWPSEVMPRWLQQAAHVLPTAWAMDGFHGLISFGRGLPAVVVPSLVLLGFATAFTLLGARFLRPER